MSWIPLLRPFVWPAMLIPILPEQLSILVQAPVPFLIGASTLPKDLPDDILIVDIQTKTIYGDDGFPDLPRFFFHLFIFFFFFFINRNKEFDASFNKDYKELKSTFKGELPVVTSSYQLRLCTNISRTFERHLCSFFKNFRAYCIRDISDKQKPISIFMKENYLIDQPQHERAFLKRFLETQMFSTYVIFKNLFFKKDLQYFLNSLIVYFNLLILLESNRKKRKIKYFFFLNTIFFKQKLKFLFTL